MTLTSPEIPVGARRIVVRDKEGPLPFMGEVIVDLSWTYDMAYERGLNRWTDMTLYRVLQKNSPYKYVIQVVGRSALYHRVPGPCVYGFNTTVGRIRRDDERYEALIPCSQPRCQPADLDDLSDFDTVAVEENIYTLYKCQNAEDVVHVMRTRADKGMGKLSMKLLQVASEDDPAIEEALLNTRTL